MGKIYCFDLDDTICSHDKSGRYMNAEPMPDRILAVNKLKAAGNTIIIDTARGSITGEDWHARTAMQLKSWGVQYDELRTGTKTFADVYVDDKAISDADFFRVMGVADAATD